jgi:hypothetical protein
MNFQDLNLNTVALAPIDENPAAGFTLTLLVSRGEDRFDPRKYELPTWAGLLFKAIIKAHREQAAEIAELRTRLDKLTKAKPASARKAVA